jgi:hypothetical protein
VVPTNIATADSVLQRVRIAYPLKHSAQLVTTKEGGSKRLLGHFKDGTNKKTNALGNRNCKKEPKDDILYTTGPWHRHNNLKKTTVMHGIQ